MGPGPHELSREEAMIALEGLAPTFEAHHQTRFAPAALAASVMCSARS
jgi:ATP-dependent Clp protease ATP-binding subunit ClpA